MALTLNETRFRCTECSRVTYGFSPEHCCGFTMLVERDASRK
jgi:hypothetical protein